MEQNIKKLEEIWTADKQKLGRAQQLFHRTDDINPSLQLYASYLEIEDYDLGLVYFVPTDFILDRDEASGKIQLNATKKQVMERTWFRMPDFVAHGKARKEPLTD